MIHIALDPDATIEPGHQWLAVDDTEEGRALATLLMGPGEVPYKQNGARSIFIPHDATVDKNIVALINELAHVRFQSPELVQLTMKETTA